MRGEKKRKENGKESGEEKGKQKSKKKRKRQMWCTPLIPEENKIRVLKKEKNG